MHPLSLSTVFGWEQRNIPSIYAQRFIQRVMLMRCCHYSRLHHRGGSPGREPVE
jgi:hypothetical protein